MKYKSVNYAIVIGQLWINVPVSILIIGISYLGWSLPPFFEYAGINVLVVIFIIIIGIGISWLWWSVFITKWRVWAFNIVAEENWISLKKAAIRSSLIWPDGAIFEKTEIRNQKEALEINRINEAIHVLRQVKEIKDDLSTTKEISYSINNRTILISMLIKGFVLSIGIAILFINTWPLGLLVILIVLLIEWDYNYYKHFKRKGIVLKINGEGLFFEVPQQNFFKWEDIDWLYFEQESNTLKIKLLSLNLEKQLFQYKLGYFDIKDYDLFSDKLDVFVERFKLKYAK